MAFYNFVTQRFYYFWNANIFIETECIDNQSFISFFSLQAFDKFKLIFDTMDTP